MMMKIKPLVFTDYTTVGLWKQRRFDAEFFIKGFLDLLVLAILALLIFNTPFLEEWFVYLVLTVICIIILLIFIDKSIHGVIYLSQYEIRFTHNGNTSNHMLQNISKIIFIYRGYRGMARFYNIMGETGATNELRIVYEDMVYFYKVHLANPRDTDRIFSILNDWREQGVQITIKKELFPGIHTKGLYFIDDLIFHGKRFFRKNNEHSRQKLH